MSASSMAIGARPAPVAGAARARAPNARARSLTSASRVITTSKRRLARADTHVVFAAADSPTGEADKEEVDKTTNEDGSVVYSFGDDVIARVDTKTSFDLPPVDEKDEKVEKDDRPVTTGEAPASNAVWKRKDEPAPAPPAATPPPPPPPPRVNPNAGPAAPKFNLTPKKASQPVADVQAKTSTPSPSPPPPRLRCVRPRGRRERAQGRQGCRHPHRRHRLRRRAHTGRRRRRVGGGPRQDSAPLRL